VAMGIELAELGDPRPEVVTVEGMEFCYVPAGWFWMGSHDERHKVEIAYPYWVARYPVTNAQFLPFVEEGYRDPVYWTEAKAQGYWKNGKIRGRDRPYDYGAPYNLPNHPRVGINWYEALAFTRWLAIGKQWSGARLLTEAEWEKAARGGAKILAAPLIRPALRLTVPELVEGQEPLPPLSGLRMIRNPLVQRRHPWGNHFDANLTNSEESGIGHTNAVGAFGMGKSPYGCEEMSGNVWEWCQSQYKNDDYRPDDGRERLDVYARRVLRGGAHYTNKTNSLCFFRLRSSPSLWSNYGGFRVFRPY
ncbi:MAG: formylglycine-generating enzyme family protein, partial [Ardenticatenaceae bacterium]